MEKTDFTNKFQKTFFFRPALAMTVATLAISASIVAGGHILSQNQAAALAADRTRTEAAQAQLLKALSDAHQTPARLRLEELAGLPLVPELVELAGTRPGTQDVKELKAYLQTVLDAARSDTGLTQIALLDTNGHELIGSKAAPSPDARPARRLSAPVFGLSQTDQPAGQIIGLLPEITVTLLPDGTDLPRAAPTASIPSPSSGASVSSSRIPEQTRMFSLAAGLATALIGLTSALVLHTRRKRS